jgi:erythromycin esterase-like protein
VVFLGEASHGDGRTEEVKTALVQRLVGECGFNAVFFESSFYEFLSVTRSARQGRPVSMESVAAAVGGVWKFDQEMQPLLEFLADRVNKGQLRVGGLDFQIGGLGQPYSNEVLFAEMAVGLSSARRTACLAAYHSRVFGSAPANGTSAAERDATLKSCLDDVAADPHGAPGGPAAQADRVQALKNMRAWLDHIDGDAPSFNNSRDRMMADNLFWLIERHTATPAKVIVWTHNAHAARDAGVLPGSRGADNLGTLVGRKLGPQLYALGITACSGEFRWSRDSNRVLPVPPVGSIEARYCVAVPEATSLVGAADMQAAGFTTSSLIGHVFHKANWFIGFDGVLILDREHPPSPKTPP